MRSPTTLEYDLAGGGARRARRPYRALALPADRRRGRDRGQQQCRRRAAGAERAGGGPRGDRLARRADRDRRRLPHPRHHGARRLPAGRGRHHQPHASQGLRRGDRAGHRGDHEGPSRRTTPSQGFTKSVSAAELVPLAREKGLPVIEDLGSGTLVDLETWGLPHEPTAREAIEAGIDVVTFSGDKLLGGPQAGLLVGTQGADRAHRHESAEARAAPRQGAAGGARGDAAALRRSRAGWCSACRRSARWRARRARSARRPSACCRRSPRALGTDWQAGIEPVRGQIGSGALPVDLLPSFALCGAGQGPRQAGRRLPRPADPGDRPHRGRHAAVRPAHARRRGGLRRPAGRRSRA